MKKIITLFMLLTAMNVSSQEGISELVDVFSTPIDTLLCGGDTITRAYWKVERTLTENGTSSPSSRLDTTLIQSRGRRPNESGCPADSLQVARSLFIEATRIQNRTANAMSTAFQRARRDQQSYRNFNTIYTRFSGVEFQIELEERLWPNYKGVYAIIDVQTQSTVRATMIRVGANNRYRLRVDDGQTGAGTLYPIVPDSRECFTIRNYASAALPAANYTMYMDADAGRINPVFRHAGYLEGGDKDIVRIVKIR